MKETITLSRREVQRMQVLDQVVRGTLTLRAAAVMMKVCYRQAKRLMILLLLDYRTSTKKRTL